MTARSSSVAYRHQPGIPFTGAGLFYVRACKLVVTAG